MRHRKGLYLCLACLLNIFGIALMVILNSWATFMMTPPPAVSVQRPTRWCTRRWRALPLIPSTSKGCRRLCRSTPCGRCATGGRACLGTAPAW
jgi:hypothetical protein